MRQAKINKLNKRLDTVIKKLNASNGGGNPYHDELGRFAEGPSTAFGKYRGDMASYALKYGYKRGKVLTRLSEKENIAATETKMAMRKIEETLVGEDGRHAKRSDMNAPEKAVFDLASNVRGLAVYTKYLAETPYLRDRPTRSGDDEYGDVLGYQRSKRHADEFAKRLLKIRPETLKKYDLYDAYKAALAGYNTMKYITKQHDMTHILSEHRKRVDSYEKYGGSM